MFVYIVCIEMCHFLKVNIDVQKGGLSLERKLA